MPTFLSLAALAALCSLPTALAAIGPTATLTISDASVTPDGYARAAVLAGGTFPGPLIQGNKVRYLW